LKKRYITFALIFFMLFSLLFLSTCVSAKIRKSYLTDFILDNRISKTDGFTNSINEDTMSFEATHYSLIILDNNGLLNQEVNPSGLSTTLKDQLEIRLDNTEINLYEMFYILNSLELLGFENLTNLKEKIGLYLNQSEIASGGFAPTNASESSTIISTYFAIKNYEIFGKETPNKTLHLDWVQDCYNMDGGFGGDPTLPSTLLNTYFALLIILELNGTINLPDSLTTLSYIKSFYTSNGGYLPDSTSTTPLLSSTYYAIHSISLININEYNNKGKTISWILERQNLIDGGFSDPLNNPKDQFSSVSTSYFAYETLITLGAISYLDQQFGKVEFNWIILLIVLLVISVIIGLGFYLWKKRKI